MYYVAGFGQIFFLFENKRLPQVKNSTCWDLVTRERKKNAIFIIYIFKKPKKYFKKKKNLNWVCGTGNFFFSPLSLSHTHTLLKIVLSLFLFLLLRNFFQRICPRQECGGQRKNHSDRRKITLLLLLLLFFLSLSSPSSRLRRVACLSCIRWMLKKMWPCRIGIDISAKFFVSEGRESFFKTKIMEAGV